MAQEHQEYIQTKVNPILESLVTQILLERPDNPVPFMIKWLSQQSKTPIPKMASEGGDVEDLKKELDALKASVKELEQKSGLSPAPSAGDEEEEEDDGDDDVVEDMPAPPANYTSRGPRSSVSAEAYGEWNKKRDFTPPVYPKSDTQKTRIREVLGKSFLFAPLDEKDLTLVVDAMQEKTLDKETRIIQEGDDGECLYVIEKGTMDCFKKIQGEEKLVKTCVEGDAFGELALLYNCPRAASVQSRDDVVLWSLDRETFNAIVKDAAQKKREMYDQFLKSVPLLESIEQYERNQLADALKQEKFSRNDTIVKQGDPGDKFFIVEEGECIATKTFVSGQKPQEVMQYKSGDYFGELALLKNEPRAANIIAKTDCKVLSIDRRTFKRLLGPLEEMLKRNVSKYT